MATSARMPALFVGHGSPMNVVRDNDYTRSIRELGGTLPRPRSILVVSAHWLTAGTFVTCADRPRQIYDFYGFPEELYAVRYEPPGAPDEARGLCDEARGSGAAIACDDGQWGLDHASWSVLKHLVPDADVPVWELSLDVTKGPAEHLALAPALAHLRDRGVLVIGSGNLVHNLRRISWDDDAKPFDWAVEADAWFRDRLAGREHERLLRYREAGEAVGLAVPSEDHYLPMLYAVALQGEGEGLAFFHEGIQNGSVSMRCFRIG